MLGLVSQQWHHNFLSMYLSKLHFVHSLGQVRQAAILDFQRMVPDASIVQPVLRQGKQALAELPMLRRGWTPICSRHMDSVAHDRVGQKPVSTDIAPRVLHRGGDCLEGDVAAAGGADGSVTHLHGGGIGDAVQDVPETVVGVHTDIGAARGRMVVEAGCGAVGLAQSVVGG